MPYDGAAKAQAKEHVAAIRAATVCARCGRQPIEWHHPDHDLDTNRRIAHLTALGFPISVINDEIARCEALCRSCHMKEDGRMAALEAAHPRRAGMVLVDPRPCADCGAPTKPMRLGLCRRCYDARRRP